jgi:hypothetical protein
MLLGEAFAYDGVLSGISWTVRMGTGLEAGTSPRLDLLRNSRVVASRHADSRERIVV